MRRILLSALLALASALAGAQGLDVEYGPWVTAVNDDGFTVLWVTEDPGLAWVELSDGRRFYHEFAGRRIFERLHSVKVSGLKPGTGYDYSIGCSPLKDGSNARDPKFHPEVTASGYHAKTFGASARKCHFAVFNDIHCDLPRYRTFASSVEDDGLDFIFLNGDIASAGNYVLDTLAHYDFEALQGCTDHIPVMFARGNHEGRGDNPKLVLDMLPTVTGQFYYAFRQGPAAFVVFDAGETHEDRSLAYCGKTEYEDYINVQMEWFKEIAKEPWFADAPMRICMIHVPMINIGEEFTLQLWLNRHCTEILNEAGIDLMISADLHEFQFHDAGTMGNDFPIIVNDDYTRVDVSCSGRNCLVTMFDTEGHRTFSWRR